MEEKSEIINLDKEEEELGVRGQNRNVRNTRKQVQGRGMENNRTKRNKKGGEWEERVVLFDIDSYVI